MGSAQPIERPRSKPVASKLKRLAEVRARAADELEVHLIAHKAVERSYLKLQAKLRQAQDRFTESEKQRDLLINQVTSLDKRIKAVDPDVNPVHPPSLYFYAGYPFSSKFSSNAKFKFIFPV